MSRQRQGGRRAARRAALFALYRWDLTGKPLESELGGDADTFVRDLVEGVAERRAELDAAIDRVSKGWPADRLGVLERNILRAAIFELEGDTVPVEVAISEAVNLAKRYASDDAAKLVNGILGQIARARA